MTILFQGKQTILRLSLYTILQSIKLCKEALYCLIQVTLTNCEEIIDEGHNS